MVKIQEFQFVHLMRVASEQLTYCKYIGEYPLAAGKHHFDTVHTVDQFYKTVHNACFSEALLIVGGLLDYSDERVISFFNWPEFKKEKRVKLRVISKRFEDQGLKKIRDQTISHADAGNDTNLFPDVRRHGIINIVLVRWLAKILDELIAEFKDYTKRFTTPYAPDVFTFNDADLEIRTVMKQAPPKLTDGPII